MLINGLNITKLVVRYIEEADVVEFNNMVEVVEHEGSPMLVVNNEMYDSLSEVETFKNSAVVLQGKLLVSPDMFLRSMGEVFDYPELFIPLSWSVSISEDEPFELSILKLTDELKPQIKALLDHPECVL